MDKIAVFHAGALGDLINVLPSLAALRAQHPKARITAWVRSSWAPLLTAGGVAHQTDAIDSPGNAPLFGPATPPEELAERLRGFDLAVSWVRSPELLGHLKALGLRTAGLEAAFPPPPGSGHAVDYLARPVAALGIAPDSPWPRLAIAAKARRDEVVLHPGSGSAQKNWPAQRLAQAGRAVAAATGLELAILEGPADAAPAAQLRSALGPTRTYRELEILDLARVLAGARLVIGNDSGVSHLAGALGTPVVAVFGPTDPAIWAVRQPWAENLGGRPAEAGQESPSPAPVDWIDAKPVVAAALRLLGPARRPRP